MAIFFEFFLLWQDLRAALDAGKDLGMPDGVLFNGKGPYRYNDSVPTGIDYETFNVQPGMFIVCTRFFIPLVFSNYTQGSAE